MSSAELTRAGILLAYAGGLLMAPEIIGKRRIARFEEWTESRLAGAAARARTLAKRNAYIMDMPTHKPRTVFRSALLFFAAFVVAVPTYEYPDSREPIATPLAAVLTLIALFLLGWSCVALLRGLTRHPRIPEETPPAFHAFGIFVVGTLGYCLLITTILGAMVVAVELSVSALCSLFCRLLAGTDRLHRIMLVIGTLALTAGTILQWMGAN